MDNNQLSSEIDKADILITEMRSYLPQYDGDLYGFAKFVKSKYGFWPDVYYREDGEIVISISLDALEGRISYAQ